MKRTKYILIVVAVLVVLLAIFSFISRKQRPVIEHNNDQVESIVIETNVESEQIRKDDISESKVLEQSEESIMESMEESVESFDPITMDEDGEVVIIVPEGQGHDGQ